MERADVYDEDFEEYVELGDGSNGTAEFEEVADACIVKIIKGGRKLVFIVDKGASSLAARGNGGLSRPIIDRRLELAHLLNQVPCARAARRHLRAL